MVTDFESISSRLAAFDTAHGKSIRSGNVIYFEDGANRETDRSGVGVMNDPPAHPLLRARAIFRYHDLCTRAAINLFDSAKRDALNHALGAAKSGYPSAIPDREQTAAKLLALKTAAQKALNGRNAAEREVERLTPETYSDFRGDAHGRRINDEFLSTVQSIEL